MEDPFDETGLFVKPRKIRRGNIVLVDFGSCYGCRGKGYVVFEGERDQTMKIPCVDCSGTGLKASRGFIPIVSLIGEAPWRLRLKTRLDRVLAKRRG